MILLPWIDTLQRACAATGPIGEIREIVAHRSLFRYHGLAFGRRLADLSKCSKEISAVSDRSRIRYRLGEEFSLIMEEPRCYETGRIYIQGTNGMVSDRRHENSTQIRMLVEDGHCIGFRIGDISTSLSSLESRLIGKVAKSDTVITKMNEMKRVGLYRLLCRVQQNQTTWSIKDGLIDSYLDKRVHTPVAGLF